MNLEKRLEALYIALIMLYAFLLPVHYKTSVKVLLAALVLSLYFIFSRKKNIRGVLFKFKFPLLYFIVLVLGTLYSQHLGEAISLVTNKLTIIIACLVIALAGSSFITLGPVLLSFIAGTFAASSFCIGYAIYRDFTEGAYWAYYHLVFTQVIGSHPIYMGYFVNFSIVIVTFYTFSKETIASSVPTKIIGLLSILFFAFVHILLSGRLPIVALSLCLIFWFATRVNSKAFFVRAFVIVTIFTIIVISALRERTLILDRFKDVFIEQKRLSDTHYGGYLERLMLWKAGIEANDNILFGVGTGDAQTVLNEYFLKNNYDISYVRENYNTHNQYVQVFLSNGLVGVISFVLMLFEPTVRMFRERRFIEFMFFSPFVFYGVTEVFLGRFQGFGFYFFFYSLIVFSNHETKNEK